MAHSDECRGRINNSLEDGESGSGDHWQSQMHNRILKICLDHPLKIAAETLETISNCLKETYGNKRNRRMRDQPATLRERQVSSSMGMTMTLEIAKEIERPIVISVRQRDWIGIAL